MDEISCGSMIVVEGSSPRSRHPAGSRTPTRIAGSFALSPRDIAALQHELLLMPRSEILKMYLDLEIDDPRFEVVEAVVKAYKLAEQAA